MASRLQKRVKMQTKLYKLNNIPNSKAVKRNIILDIILRIYKLKLKLEAIKREYLVKNIQEVKVEKFGENFLVNITCKKGENMLVSILETFEEMSLNVVQAKVSYTACSLCVDAIVKGPDQGGIDNECIKLAVQKAIDKEVG